MCHVRQKKAPQRNEVRKMKDDNKTEMEIMEIINAIRNSGNTELIQIATLSYLKGLEDGVRIEQTRKIA